MAEPAAKRFFLPLTSYFLLVADGYYDFLNAVSFFLTDVLKNPCLVAP